jgi:hypothetical protein
VAPSFGQQLASRFGKARTLGVRQDFSKQSAFLYMVFIDPARGGAGWDKLRIVSGNQEPSFGADA